MTSTPEQGNLIEFGGQSLPEECRFALPSQFTDLGNAGVDLVIHRRTSLGSLKNTLKKACDVISDDAGLVDNFQRIANEHYLRGDLTNEQLGLIYKTAWTDLPRLSAIAAEVNGILSLRTAGDATVLPSLFSSWWPKEGSSEYWIKHWKDELFKTEPMITLLLEAGTPRPIKCKKCDTSPDVTKVGWGFTQSSRTGEGWCHCKSAMYCVYCVIDSYIETSRAIPGPRGRCKECGGLYGKEDIRKIRQKSASVRGEKRKTTEEPSSSKERSGTAAAVRSKRPATATAVASASAAVEEDNVDDFFQ